MAGLGRIIGGIIVLLILGIPFLILGLGAVVLGSAFFGGLGFALGLVLLIPGLLFFLLGIFLILSGLKVRRRAAQPAATWQSPGMPPGGQR